MLKYKCLVLDHDDTVVQSMKTLSYPFFCYILERLHPDQSISLQDYIFKCHELGFVELCQKLFSFTPEETAWEHIQWMNYIRNHTPPPYPEIGRIIHRQISAGGILCVVSHSSKENILRDYRVHFGLAPDAIYGMDLPREQRKPHPWPLEDIMRRFNLKPEEILVVDDMKLSCAMAAPLGVDVAFADWADLGVDAISREMKMLCKYHFTAPMQLYDFLFLENA